MERTTSSVIWESKSIKWDINNFSEICGIRRVDSEQAASDQERVLNSQEYKCILDIDFLQSPGINVGSIENGIHGLWIVKIMKSADDANQIDLNLELTQMGNEFDEALPASCECFFKYRITVVGADGQPFLVKDNDTIILLKSGNCWCEPGLLKVDYLKHHADEILKDDVLQLKIDIHVLSDLQHVNSEALKETKDKRKRKGSWSPEGDFEVMDLCQTTLAKQVLSTLWETRLNSDAVVECAASKFAVHRSVLSCASPVFRAAFNSKDTNENVQGKIVISDIGPAALELVLRFIYCDM